MDVKKFLFGVLYLEMCIMHGTKIEKKISFHLMSATFDPAENYK